MTDGFNQADRSCGASPVIKGELNEHLAEVGTRYDEYVTQVTSRSQLMLFLTSRKIQNPAFLPHQYYRRLGFQATNTK
jgi:hypothetical protein